MFVDKVSFSGSESAFLNKCKLCFKKNCRKEREKHTGLACSRFWLRTLAGSPRNSLEAIDTKSIFQQISILLEKCTALIDEKNKHIPQ